MIDTLEHLTVSEFLRNRYPFVIPKYQRGYAWEKEEVADFCKDVQALIGSDADTHHFFGSVLTSRLPVPRSERGDYLEIIDGQQRISTFFLTLSLILHALKKIVDSATAAGETAIKEAAEANYQLWTNSYVQYDEINNNRMVKCLRLTLSKVDAKFFEDLVYDRSAAIGGAVQPSSHQRLAIAKRLLWKNLFRDCIEGNSCTLAQRLDHVCKVKGAVLDKCRLIHVRSTSRKDGYSLFMVLNDRGRDISDAEKLRASTLELLENHQVQQNHVEACWDSILQKTPNIIEGFLKSFYASKVGTRAGRDLFRGYSDHFIPFEKASDVSTADGLQIRQFVDEIRVELEIYVLLEAGEWPYSNPSASLWQQTRLKRLINTLRHTLSLPLLLSAARMLDEAKFSDLVVFLERLCFRHITIARAHAGSLGERYYAQAIKMRAEGAGFDLNACYQDIISLSQAEITAEQFKTRIKEKLVYKAGNQQGNRELLYFLTIIEDFYDWYNRGQVGVPTPNSANVLVDIDNLEIEHIYPQNALPGHVDATLERLKDKLGNLTFFTPTDNRVASNAPFNVKRPTFHASGSKLNQKLGSEVDWNPWEEVALHQRQEDLLQRALAIFMF